MTTASMVDYRNWLASRAIDVRQHGPWACVGTPVDEFNWKLHLSSTQTQALALLESVVPILMDRGVPFKVALDADVLGGLNEGMFGPTQVGKFITIYPAKPDSGRLLAQQLVAATQAFGGPRIVTDLHLGAVVYARYGSHSPSVQRDRLGSMTLQDEHGHGGYQVPFVLPEGIDNPFGDVRAAASEPAPASQTLGPGYLLVRPLSIHAKGTVFLALDLRQQDAARKVVLKEGRRHCLSDASGRDICDRLRHQERIHKDIAGRVRVPASGDLFTFGENQYLPLEFIEGRDLTERKPAPFASLEGADQQRLVRELLGLAATVADLHACGYVHRDLSPRNVRIAPDGAVYLLDLEMTHPVADKANTKDDVPFMQGTAGFISPQQLAGERPAVSDDVYSIGSLIVYAITGFDPRRLDLQTLDTLPDRLAHLSGAPVGLIHLACRCLHPSAPQRPGLAEIESTLQTISTALESGAGSLLQPHQTRDCIRNLARGAALEGLEWIVNGCPRDPTTHLWSSPELESAADASPLQSPHAYQMYRSTNRGVAGVVYTLARAHRFGLSIAEASTHVGAAVDWLLAHAPTADDQMPGLHFGEAGVAVAVAESVKSGLIEPGPWLYPYLDEALSGPLDWPDLTHGAAGQGIASLSCSQILEDPALARHSHRCVDYLLPMQAPDGSWPLPEGAPGLDGVVYTGLAHGVAGIVCFLATYARRFAGAASAAAAESAARRGGEWLRSAMRQDSRGDCWWPMRPDADEVWRWWCHGGPGIAMAFLDLYRLTGASAHARTAAAGLRAHSRDLRHPNLSQCHGLAGYGEALLTGYQVLGDEEFLDRALRIGADLIALRQRHSRGSTWVVENPHKPTADLMIGSGGVVHFLARLSQFDDARFSMPLTAS